MSRPSTRTSYNGGPPGTADFDPLTKLATVCPDGWARRLQRSVNMLRATAAGSTAQMLGIVSHELPAVATPFTKEQPFLSECYWARELRYHYVLGVDDVRRLHAMADRTQRALDEFQALVDNLPLDPWYQPAWNLARRVQADWQNYWSVRAARAAAKSRSTYASTASSE